MDIQHLVDRLDQLLSEGRRLPLTALITVDEDRIYNIVDQMRAVIPEEIKRANRINAEKDRIMAQAHEEAERIRTLAKQEAEELITRETVAETAHQRAEIVLERARREADNLRSEADVYVMDVLTNLEENLMHSLSVVRNGLRKIEDEGQPAETTASGQ